ncbi:hypothetical protein B0O99DRAFT_637318 [Bisporella sp. PMI_857]|nr:hypothetical protein B0O99DRAFT_637318 [Bisporella sp. PMI_857]
MDIVDSQHDIRPRVVILKSSGKGWVDFTRSIRAITLIGRGFGEFIKPARDANALCKQWRQVPIGKDYLVACTSTLKEICRKYGDHESRPMELANGIFWHRPDRLFDACECKLLKSCDRVQVLLPPSLGTKNHPQPFGYLKGAVIFGRSKRLPWVWPSKGPPIEGGGGGESDTEMEGSAGFFDNGAGERNPSNSDYATLERQDSSPSSGPSDGTPSIEMSDLVMSGALHGESTPPSSLDGSGRGGFTSPGSLGTSQTSGSPIRQGQESAMTKRDGEMASTLEVSSPSEDIMILGMGHGQRGKGKGTKRTWEQIKGIAPQFFPKKKDEVALQNEVQEEME